jgi:hypothetical protein
MAGEKETHWNIVGRYANGPRPGVSAACVMMKRDSSFKAILKNVRRMNMAPLNRNKSIIALKTN